MKNYIYFSIMPEALIGSMLPPDEFGAYMATGTKKRNKCQVMFFEIEPEEVKSIVDMKYLESRCVTKSDGKPKSSVYLSVYRVLEAIPLGALKDFYLSTENGLVLPLKKTPYERNLEISNEVHLYQELCPVNPQVASSLSPSEFLKVITDGSIQIKLPKLLFVDLKLDDPGVNPLTGDASNLPCRSAEHLADCIEILRTEDKKQMKTVQRVCTGPLLYRTIKSGFYIGAGDELLFYRFPSLAEIEETNYEFYRAI